MKAKGKSNMSNTVMLPSFNKIHHRPTTKNNIMNSNNSSTNIITRYISPNMNSIKLHNKKIQHDLSSIIIKKVENLFYPILHYERKNTD